MIPLAAEPITSIGTFPITNSLINAWIAVVFFVIVAAIARKRVGLTPKGIDNVFETIVEFLLNEVQKVTGDRERARRFFPIVATIFLFVLTVNWMGLIPGVGSFGVYQMVDDQVELVPLFRAASSDLNLTLAMALFAVVMSHIFGVRAVGTATHLSKFFNLRGILRSLKKGPMAILVACIEFAVGLLELISEFAKVLSLTFRLFGNVFAGEILLTVMMGIFAYALPIPFLFLELLVGIIQATVFSMLTLAFFTVATETHGQEHAMV
jgi:F-type H+-transporting ATPase subunit a